MLFGSLRCIVNNNSNRTSQNLHQCYYDFFHFTESANKERVRSLVYEIELFWHNVEQRANTSTVCRRCQTRGQNFFPARDPKSLNTSHENVTHCDTFLTRRPKTKNERTCGATRPKDEKEGTRGGTKVVETPALFHRNENNNA
jgi:hypothetical protein